MNARRHWLAILLLTGILIFTTDIVHAQEGSSAGTQTATLLFEEAEAVYHANLVRRQYGAPPLRWNVQLTAAARWFSWDSVVNRPDAYCGHQDTQGNWPNVRTQNAGYKGVSGAENAYCGYLTGEEAVAGWMNSAGHRENLLDPASREVGLGYYRSSDSGRGYVTQDFGHDAAYAPVVIDNEALSTPTDDVELYVHDAKSAGGLNSRGATTEMQVSNDACFTGARWEAYTTTKSWSLTAGDPGWRTVYVKTRDQFNRTAMVQDSIYFGVDVPNNALASLPLSTVQADVTLYDLNTDTLPLMQFSLGWLSDDSDETFHKWWGPGERVNDAQAWGGTAYQLKPGDGESFAWLVDTTFVKDAPFVAYFRLKVNDNQSGGEVARISVKGGGAEYGPRALKARDFTRPGEYQEFAVPFTFHSNPDDEFLIFQIWRSGSADVSFDAVTIFTAPQPVASPYTWQPPGENYRGQGVWVRYTDGADTFSPLAEASTVRRELTSSAASLSVLVDRSAAAPAPIRVEVSAQCASAWQPSTDATWLDLQAIDGAILVSVDPTALENGIHMTEIVIAPDNTANLAPLRIPVTAHVVDALTPLYLPVVQR